MAPVYAVAGNRDWFQGSLPRHLLFSINGVPTLLTHGHVNLYQYWVDKGSNFLYGYQFERYARRLPNISPEARLYIFGHSHHAENRWLDGRLFFNPGSSSVAVKPDFRLSFGIINVCYDGRFSGEIITLDGAVVNFGKWVEGDKA